jgi:hypothetical protein
MEDASKTETASFKKLFQEQYMKFADELEETFPELEPALKRALALSEDDRITQFKKQVLPKMMAVQSKKEAPDMLLPGVKLEPSVWASLSDNNKKSVLSYLGILCSFVLFDGDGDGVGEDISGGSAEFGGAWKGASKWYEDLMNEWKTKTGGIDLSSMTSKITSLFGISGEGLGGFKLPDKFMKGHLARLVEELMRDFKPEDFGFSEEDIKALEKDVGEGGNIMGAFEMLMKVYTKNPDVLQNIIKKVGNRLRAKVMSGAINPKEIAAEAEELMKEFTENSEFSSLMENIKGMFGFEDPELARAAGREGSARVAAARDRLRKKLAKKQAEAAAGTTPAPVQTQGAATQGANKMKKNKGK